MTTAELVRRYIDAWNTGDTSGLDELLTAGFVRHVPVTAGPAEGAVGPRG